MNIRLMRPAHRRTFGQVLRDMWLALRGETYVTLNACCHTCDKDFLIEVYQDLNFPMTNGGIGIAYANFNDVMYYPTLRARYVDTGATYEEPNRRRDWFGCHVLSLRLSRPKPDYYAFERRWARIHRPAE